MKRSLLMIFLTILMVVPFSTVMAYNFDEPGPHMMAELVPDSAEIFAATRIGAGFIEELDAITLALYDKLPEGLAPEQSYTIDFMLRTSLAEEGIDWDEVSALMGNYAAMSVTPVDGFNSGEQPLAIAIAEITDQGGVEAFILSNLPNTDDIPPREMVGDTIVYQDENGPEKLMITPTHLIFTNDPDYNPAEVAAPLSANADFSAAVGGLAADRYNMFAYMSETAMQAMLSESNNEELQALGFNPMDSGAMVAGATILAGNTFTIDVAIQTAGSMPSSSVNLDFLNAMPGTTDAFIVASDLTNVYRTTVATIRDVALANDEEDPTAQIPVMFNFTGLDLEDEVLSWTTGNYGIFVGADFVGLLNEAMSTGTVSELSFDAGIVIEATDPALAQNAAAKLGETLAGFLANEEEITISQSDVNGVAITSIAMELPMDPSMPPIPLEFVLTATDEFFFFGTRSAFDTIMGGDTLAANADFGKSSQYFLDSATSVWYTNSDGFVISTIVPLALMGPAIDNVFDNIIEELGSEPPQDEPSSAPMPLGPQTELIMEGLNAYDELLTGATISTSIDEGGIVRFRATMSVNP